MILKDRTESGIHFTYLGREEMEQMLDMFSIDGEGLSQEEMEVLIQQAWDEQFCRPEYNVWHRETRHIDPSPKARRMDGRRGYIQGNSDDEGFDPMDCLLFADNIEELENRIEYDEICTWIREVLAKKPEWAEAFIAVRMGREPIRRYAARTGADENSISQKLKRAEKKLRDHYKNRQI